MTLKAYILSADNVDFLYSKLALARVPLNTAANGSYSRDGDAFLMLHINKSDSPSTFGHTLFPNSLGALYQMFEMMFEMKSKGFRKYLMQKN